MLQQIYKIVANTPNIDKLALGGFGGFTNNVPDGYTPGSDVANMSIFGYNPADFYTGRGPLEAGSVGIDTTPCDVIFRCNTICEKDDTMFDFNAGHITSEEASVLIDALNDYFNEKYDNFKGKFYSGISYRHLFVYSCDNLEDAEKLAVDVLKQAGLPVNEKDLDKGTEALFFMSEAQAEALAQIAVNEPEKMKDKEKRLRLKKTIVIIITIVLMFLM